MALSERRILKQVTVLPAQNAVQVQWADQVLRDNTVISEQFHRKAYTQPQTADFVAEVEGAANYLLALGWDVNNIPAPPAPSGSDNG